MEELIEKLNKHRSPSQSKWRERGVYRMENKAWLRYSQAIAMIVLDAMEETGLTQKALAEKMGCSQQYISKILKGQENMSLETISKLESALDLDMLSISPVSVSGYSPAKSMKPIYLNDSDSTKYGKSL